MPGIIRRSSAPRSSLLFGHRLRGGDPKVQTDFGFLIAQREGEAADFLNTDVIATVFFETSVNHFMSPGDISLQMDVHCTEKLG
ncbi:hypothetical protein [Mesorhizobium hawassense]|uniref:hypothetical protein n=1 Tax=Mesorhizobium hawassense TaxID=1209954 RepID=UPI00142DD5D7|nr:hypothetical protein [Mesorhizobium hawassense]